jgi:hypothetical protein
MSGRALLAAQSEMQLSSSARRVAFRRLDDATRTFTAIAHEFIAPGRTLAAPARWSARGFPAERAALDPCAALQITSHSSRGDREVTSGSAPVAMRGRRARSSCASAARPPARVDARRMCAAHWQQTLAPCACETPDRALDVLATAGSSIRRSRAPVGRSGF